MNTYERDAKNSYTASAYDLGGAMSYSGPQRQRSSNTSYEGDDRIARRPRSYSATGVSLTDYAQKRAMESIWGDVKERAGNALALAGVGYQMGASPRIIGSIAMEGLKGSGLGLVSSAMDPFNATYGFGPQGMSGKGVMKGLTILGGTINPALGAAIGTFGGLAYSGIMDGLNLREFEKWRDKMEEKHGWGVGNMLSTDIEENYLSALEDKTVFADVQDLKKAAEIHRLRANTPISNIDEIKRNIEAAKKLNAAAAYESQYTTNAPEREIKARSRAITRHGHNVTSNMNMSDPRNLAAMDDAIDRRGRGFFSDDTLNSYDKAKAEDSNKNRGDTSSGADDSATSKNAESTPANSGFGSGKRSSSGFSAGQVGGRGGFNGNSASHGR